NNLQKPSGSNSSTVNAIESNKSNETEGFDTSDELLDTLVKNAALTTTKDVIKQRRIARYAQRQSLRRTLQINLNEEEQAQFIKRYASSQALATDLKSIVGNDNVGTSTAIREQHSHDESYHAGHQPDVVVFAQSTEHVSNIVKYCASKRIPIIPFGTGTGVEGGVTASKVRNAHFFFNRKKILLIY
ncbi:unnamed protein product, partial [Rotaria sp. Silwood1]